MNETNRTYTAREMAMISHNLDRTGMFATILSTGGRYRWDGNARVWVIVNRTAR